jgi:hypothetical protein
MRQGRTKSGVSMVEDAGELVDMNTPLLRRAWEVFKADGEAATVSHVDSFSGLTPSSTIRGRATGPGASSSIAINGSARAASAAAPTPAGAGGAGIDASMVFDDDGAEGSASQAEGADAALYGPSPCGSSSSSSVSRHVLSSAGGGDDEEEDSGPGQRDVGRSSSFSPAAPTPKSGAKPRGVTVPESVKEELQGTRKRKKVRDPLPPRVRSPCLSEKLCHSHHCRRDISQRVNLHISHFHKLWKVCAHNIRAARRRYRNTQGAFVPR